MALLDLIKNIPADFDGHITPDDKALAELFFWLMKKAFQPENIIDIDYSADDVVFSDAVYKNGVLIYCTVAGDVKFDALGSGTQTIAVNAGEYLLDPIRVKKIYKTGTTATIKAVW